MRKRFIPAVKLNTELIKNIKPHIAVTTKIGHNILLAKSNIEKVGMLFLIITSRSQTVIMEIIILIINTTDGEKPFFKKRNDIGKFNNRVVPTVN